MNSPLLSASNLLRVLVVLIISTSSLILLKKASSSVPRTQTVQQPPATRRLFENRVPEHLPIKVKIKREKEKAFRDLTKGDWAKDFELEVKNTGEKPIYFLFFYLIVPEAKIGDLSQSFSIVYGRSALADLRQKQNDTDTPILPGDTKFLHIEEAGVRGWEDARAAGKTPPVIRGVRLIFQHLSFGDGTGFEGATGAPRLQAREGKTISSQSPPSYDNRKYNLPQRGGGGHNLEESNTAGNLVPAFFISASPESNLSTELCDCANNNCEHGYVRHIDSNVTNEHCYQCGTFDLFYNTNCLEEGGCHFVDWTTRWCTRTQSCVVAFVQDCATSPPSSSNCPGTAPNPSCRCVSEGGVYDWDCDNCGNESTYADFNVYTATGCPAYADNIGNCCFCKRRETAALFVFSTNNCAIATAVRIPRILATTVILTTRLVQLMNVVPASAIRRLKPAHQQVAEAEGAPIVATSRLLVVPCMVPVVNPTIATRTAEAEAGAWNVPITASAMRVGPAIVELVGQLQLF